MRGKRAREITSRRRERRKGVQHIPFAFFKPKEGPFD